MRTCYTCKESKSLEDFNKKTSRKDGYQTECHECNKLRSRKYYADNETKHKAVILARNLKKRQEKLRLVGEYLLQNPCVDCGEKDIRLLDFDHRGDSPKNNEVMVIAQRSGGTRIERLIEEMNKCDIRCKNCHTLKTYERMAADWRTRLMLEKGLIK